MGRSPDDPRARLPLAFLRACGHSQLCQPPWMTAGVRYCQPERLTWALVSRVFLEVGYIGLGCPQSWPYLLTCSPLQSSCWYCGAQCLHPKSYCCHQLLVGSRASGRRDTLLRQDVPRAERPCPGNQTWLWNVQVWAAQACWLNPSLCSLCMLSLFYFQRTYSWFALLVFLCRFFLGKGKGRGFNWFLLFSVNLVLCFLV